MKNTYKIDGLDCASCGADLERKLQKIKNINDVNVNYIMRKLTIDIDEDKIDAVLPNVKKVAKRFGVEIS